MLRALKIAIREWENIRVSLEEYGDIGEFDHKNHINNRLTILPGGVTLARKLIEMGDKLPAHGYFTQEASYVFTTLASRASERIGLRGSLAHTFGSGYSWIRTGWFDPSDMEEEHLIKQLFFFKIFFPLVGYFNWDFNSSVVKTKLKVVLLKFTTWQDEPGRYVQDVREYKSQLEPLWHGLSLALGFPLIDSSKEFQRWGDSASELEGDPQLLI